MLSMLNLRSLAALLILSSLWLLTPQLTAQTVFLPSFRNFSYSGAVSVPDGGQIRLGGVNTSGEQSINNGVPGLSNIPGLNRGFRNRAIGREQGAGSLSATAQVIVMEELEAQVLAEARRNQAAAGGVNEDVLNKARFLSKHVGRSATSGEAGRSRSGSWGDRR